ncbi:MAG TPA: hypothetical protein EYQ25_00125 [Planctomycetes bacterium]|nr:hypothetical protein [Planctomycetota bacterium]HIL36112.1 hypothetical protein [Planctomycetota bacterium]
MKLPLACTVILLSSCSITQKVEPIPAGTEISHVAIKQNTSVLMEGLLPELERQITSLGYRVSVYSQDPPEEADCTAEYSANWGWDLAMYLTFFRVDLYSNEVVIGATSGATYSRGAHLGSVEYNAMRGGANMGKFGSTGSKIAPLLSELFSKVTIPSDG